jgi:uncharacterized protein YdaT
MLWIMTKYSKQMEQLTPLVRSKAIEIANALLEKSMMEEEILIEVSIIQAKAWASRRLRCEEDCYFIPRIASECKPNEEIAARADYHSKSFRQCAGNCFPF